MGGFEGWGRHLCSDPATAAKRTFALTHPSNLRETQSVLMDDEHEGSGSVIVEYVKHDHPGLGRSFRARRR
jgi:hypothetical protein